MAGAAWEEWASALGVELGGEPLEWGRLANVNPPVLRSHDRYGERLDEVEFHPAWHALMALGVRHGLRALPWREPQPGAHVARAAMFVTYSQVEQGSGCPLSMTHAAVPALRAEPDVAVEATLGEDPRCLISIYFSSQCRFPNVVHARSQHGRRAPEAMSPLSG